MFNNLVNKINKVPHKPVLVLSLSFLLEFLPIPSLLVAQLLLLSRHPCATAKNNEPLKLLNVDTVGMSLPRKTLQFKAMQCNAMQSNAMQCNAMQYNTIQYNTIQYNIIQCNIMQCNTMERNVM